MVSLKDMKIELPVLEIVLRSVNKPIEKEEEEEEEDIEITKTPFNLRGSINIVNKSEDGKRIIAGYANVAVVDLDDQFIPIETLKKGIETLLKDPHYSNLMLVHQNIQIGKIIPKFKELETHVDDKGLFIVAEIRKDIQTADEIWDAILNKELNGFSIGCEVMSSHRKCDDEKCITILDEINIFEVSVCTTPVNDKSGFIVVSKSQEEYVCKECIIEKGNMTKKVETKEKIEKTKKADETEDVKETEKAEETEKAVEDSIVEKMGEASFGDRISELERGFIAITEVLQDLAKDSDKGEATDDEEKAAPWGSMDPKNQNPVAPPKSPNVPEYPKKGKAKTEDKQDDEDEEEDEDEGEGEDEEGSEVPFPEKAFDELKKSIDELKESVSNILKRDELKLSIKARDDQIESLKKTVETITKSKDESEGKPKTIQDESENLILDQDDDYIVKRGEFYRKP